LISDCLNKYVKEDQCRLRVCCTTNYKIMAKLWPIGSAMCSSATKIAICFLMLFVVQGPVKKRVVRKVKRRVKKQKPSGQPQSGAQEQSQQQRPAMA